MNKEKSDEGKSLLANRFRGFLPVVVDVETAGFNSKTDALLEVAASILSMDDEGYLFPSSLHAFHVQPFPGANIEQAAVEFNGINPHHPLRIATPEQEALTDIFKTVRTAVKKNGCTRAVLVGHNASFDLSFINAASSRNRIKKNPFHSFSCFDTATLSGLVFGQTVLVKSCEMAGIDFDRKAAHSARYDTKKTAELFCYIVNRWRELGGWPLASESEDRLSDIE